MFIDISTILFWIICDNAVNGHASQQTKFRRQITTTGNLTIWNPPLSSHVVADLISCFNACHHSIQCFSVFFDEDSSNCSMFSGTSEVDGFVDNQQYFIVVNKVFPAEFIDHANRLCSGNNSGYFFDAAVPICYKISTIPRTKKEAVDFCQESGNHLLRIKTDKKQKFVEDLNLDHDSKYRIDGEKIGAEWKYSNGERITKFYWYPGEQQEDKKSIGLKYNYKGKWDNIHSGYLHRCVCEKDIE